MGKRQRRVLRAALLSGWLAAAKPPALDRYFRHGILPTEDVSFEHVELPVNFPYVVKSDRVDDGISSASPYTSSDPSFPHYNDWIPVVNVHDRKRHKVHVLSDKNTSTPHRRPDGTTVAEFGHDWCGVGGTGKGKRDGIPCVFPFVYQNELYTSCTTRANPGRADLTKNEPESKPWCATKIHQIMVSGKKQDTLLQTNKGGQWGFCEPCSVFNNRDFRQYTHSDEVVRQWEVNNVGGWGTGLTVSDHKWNGTWVGDKTWDNVNFGRLNAATFIVQAAEKWNPSSVHLVKGGTYQIEVPPRMQLGIEQRWNDTRISVDANGYSSHYDAVSKCYVALGQCRSYLRHPRRVANANWMKLICGIGNYFTQLRPVALDLDRFMRLREEEFVSTLFEVGTGVNFTARHTGELICFANDAEGLYWNNKDNLTVNVRCDGPCKKVSDCDNNPGCINNHPVPPSAPQLCYNQSYSFTLGGTVAAGTDSSWVHQGWEDETPGEHALRLRGERKMIEWAESRTLSRFYNDTRDGPPTAPTDTMAVSATAHLHICCNASDGYRGGIMPRMQWSPNHPTGKYPSVQALLDDSLSLAELRDGVFFPDPEAVFEPPGVVNPARSPGQYAAAESEKISNGLSLSRMLAGEQSCANFNISRPGDYPAHEPAYAELRAVFASSNDVAQVCCSVYDAGVTVKYADPTGWRVGFTLALGGPAYPSPGILMADDVALRALAATVNQTLREEMVGLSHWGTTWHDPAYGKAGFPAGYDWENNTVADALGDLVQDPRRGAVQVSAVRWGTLNASTWVYRNATTGETPRAVHVDMYVRVSHSSTALALTEAILSMREKLAHANAAVLAQQAVIESQASGGSLQQGATGFTVADKKYADDFETLFKSLTQSYGGHKGRDYEDENNQPVVVSFLPVQVLSGPFSPYTFFVAPPDHAADDEAVDDTDSDFEDDPYEQKSFDGAQVDGLEAGLEVSTELFALMQGNTQTYTLRLKSPPLHPVVVELHVRTMGASSISEPKDGTKEWVQGNEYGDASRTAAESVLVSPSRFVFTSAEMHGNHHHNGDRGPFLSNWSIPQVVTVKIADDASTAYDYEIVHQVESDDQRYAPETLPTYEAGPLPTKTVAIAVIPRVVPPTDTPTSSPTEYVEYHGRERK